MKNRRDGAGTNVTLILPPDPPDSPAGYGMTRFRRRLQGFLEVGGGWRMGDDIFGMCQIRQEVFGRPPSPALPPWKRTTGEGSHVVQMGGIGDYAVGKVAAAVRLPGATDVIPAYGIICSVVQ
jgi:hypothetical protein